MNATPTEPDRVVPFGDVVSPWVAHGVRSLAPLPAIVSPAAVEALVDQLRRRLAEQAGPALLAAFARDATVRGSANPGAQQRYRAFSAAYRRNDGQALRSAFPMLGPLLDQVVEQWVASTHEMVDHLRADACEVARLTGVDERELVVEEFRAPLGDHHRNGRAVIGVRPIGGRGVVYKPRSMRAEAQILGAIGDVTGAAMPSVVDRIDHGWMAWVRPEAVVDRTAYWRVAGGVAAVLHLAGAVDMHGENVIATCVGPVPIDLECAGLPVVVEVAEHRLHTFDSVLTTGLFPGWFRQDGPIAEELAGMFGRPVRGDGSFVMRWEHLGTDAIGLRPSMAVPPSFTHLPLDASGRPVPVDLAALLAGFTDALEQLVADGSPVDSWQPVAGRYLLRSTGVYVEALKRAVAPDALLGSREFDAAIELPPLHPSQRRLLGDRVDDVAAAERAALRRLDIPLHVFCDRDLVLDGGTVLPEVVRADGMDRLHAVRERLDAGGRRVQRELVRLAVEQHSTTDRVNEADLDRIPRASVGGPLRRSRTALAGRPDVDELVAAAATICDGLERDRLGDQERPVWLEVDDLWGTGRLDGTTDSADLYLGRHGIAVAFAAMSAVSSDERWAACARRALWPVDDDGASHWPNGHAGEAYARLAVGRMLDDRALTMEAIAVIAALLHEHLDHLDRLDHLDHGARFAGPDESGIGSRVSRLDLLGGSAGTVCMALSALDAIRLGGDQDPAFLRSATAFVDRFVSDVQTQLAHPVWARRLRSIGMAHAGTGVSYALMRAARTLGHDEARAVATDLLDAEDARIARRGGVGAKLRRLQGGGKEPRRGWCWGASGYLEARLTDCFDATPWRVPEHLDATIDAVVAEGTSQRDHLCCGRAGYLVALERAERRLGSERAAEARSVLARCLVDRAGTNNALRFHHEVGFDSPSLFAGRAGVVMALCRAARPDLVVDVLAVE